MSEGIILGGAEVTDYNPNTNLATTGLAYGMTGEKDVSEPAIHATLALVQNREGSIRARWEDRCEKEGTLKWQCPFVHEGSYAEFDTIEECQAHIDTHFAATVELLKIKNVPAELYSPKKLVIPPKRTYADFYDAATAERMQRGHDAAESVRPLLQTLKTQLFKPQAKTKWMNEPEGLILQKLAHMSTDDIQQIGREASQAGKINIARAARRHLGNRSTEPNW